MAEIKLSRGLSAVVDDDDLPELLKFRWCAKPGADDQHMYVWCSNLRLLMHRVLMSPPAGLVVDHINGNGLDNRRDNLRIATHAQNAANKIKRQRSNAGYKGVSFDQSRRKYRAYCGSGPGRLIGFFDDPLEAAMAYDERAARQFGEFAALNFPAGTPPVFYKRTNRGVIVNRSSGFSPSPIQNEYAEVQP